MLVRIVEQFLPGHGSGKETSSPGASEMASEDAGATSNLLEQNDGSPSLRVGGSGDFALCFKIALTT